MVTERETCQARAQLLVWLKENEKTQAWLARVCGVSAPSVIAWLDGSSRPVLHLREVIAALTSIPVSDWDYPSEQLARESALARVEAAQAQ
jgi:DNA-binding XRE family transcriptional regulator